MVKKIHAHAGTQDVHVYIYPPGMYTDSMRNRHAAAIYMAWGLVFLAYYVTLTVLEDFQFPSFSLVWILAALVLMGLSLAVVRRGKDRKHVLMQGAGKTLKAVAVTVMCAVALAGAAALFMILTPEVSDGRTETEYLMVLGSTARKDGSLSQISLERVDAAAEYLMRHDGTCAVVTGGRASPGRPSEAEGFARSLEERGVSRERILLEDRADDTVQNFIFSARVMAANDGIGMEQILDMPVTVVTSGFHLARAEMIARRLGFTEVHGIPSRVPAVYVPDAYLREICGWIKLSLRILLTGEPSRLLN